MENKKQELLKLIILTGKCVSNLTFAETLTINKAQVSDMKRQSLLTLILFSFSYTFGLDN